VAVRRVRLTAGGFWSEAKSGGRGKSTLQSKRPGGPQNKSTQKDLSAAKPSAPRTAKGANGNASKSGTSKTSASQGKNVTGSSRLGGAPRQAARSQRLPQVSQFATSLWSPANGRRPRQVDASEHALAWWRCPRGKHPDWRQYIDIVAAGNGHCPGCGPRTTRSKPTSRRTRTRKIPELSRHELSPRERALGTNALLRQLNPPEAIRDSWR
jgi:hypothetical protein